MPPSRPVNPFADAKWKSSTFKLALVTPVSVSVDPSTNISCQSVTTILPNCSFDSKN